VESTPLVPASESKPFGAGRDATGTGNAAVGPGREIENVREVPTPESPCSDSIGLDIDMVRSAAVEE